jgi:hypothetical protein
MSISIYRSQVDRLRKEMAELERKAADERVPSRAAASRLPPHCRLDHTRHERRNGQIQDE